MSEPSNGKNARYRANKCTVCGEAVLRNYIGRCLVVLCETHLQTAIQNYRILNTANRAAMRPSRKYVSLWEKRGT